MVNIGKQIRGIIRPITAVHTGSIAFKLNAAKSAPWLANVDDSEVLDVRPANSGIDRVAKPSKRRARVVVL